MPLLDLYLSMSIPVDLPLSMWEIDILTALRCGWDVTLQSQGSRHPWRCAEDWETECPKSKDGKQHCNCWYDGDGCCWCGDPPDVRQQPQKESFV